jgi:hypothetical protein
MEIIILLLIVILLVLWIKPMNFEVYRIESEGNFYKQKPVVEVVFDEQIITPGNGEYSNRHFNRMSVPDSRLLIGSEEIDESIVYEDQLPQLHRNYNPAIVHSRISQDGDDVMGLYDRIPSAVVPH